MSRPDNFDLAAAITQPNFTPGRRDAAALLALLLGPDDDVGEHAANALTKLGVVGLTTVTRTSNEAPDDKDPTRCIIALSKFATLATDLATPAGDALLQVFARENLSARARRYAAIAVGKLLRADATDALLTFWDAAQHGAALAPDIRRAMTQALAATADSRARERLAAIEAGDDKELARLRDRGMVMAARDALRSDESTADSSIDAGRALPEYAVSSRALDAGPHSERPLVRSISEPPQVTVMLTCRHGLGPLLVEELARNKAIRMSDDRRRDQHFDYLPVTLRGTWANLFDTRGWMTAGIMRRLPSGGLEDAIITAICDPEVATLVAALTVGPQRWRLDFVHSGHQRARTWRIADAVSKRAPQLINDPSATAWDFIVDERLRTLELRPRRVVDPRFAWRCAEIPASSHPTVAAALAELAEPTATDVIWDPFVGAGAELIECARRVRPAGPTALFGTDLAQASLDAASANLTAATELNLVPAQHWHLGLGDARRFDPRSLAPDMPPITLIISNPPLGGRIRGDAPQLLADAMPHFARQLAPAGRLVWVTPAPYRTDPVGLGLKLRLMRDIPVDLGGITAHVQRWQKKG